MLMQLPIQPFMQLTWIFDLEGHKINAYRNWNILVETVQIPRNQYQNSKLVQFSTIIICAVFGSVSPIKLLKENRLHRSDYHSASSICHWFQLNYREAENLVSNDGARSCFWTDSSLGRCPKSLAPVYRDGTRNAVAATVAGQDHEV